MGGLGRLLVVLAVGLLLGRRLGMRLLVGALGRKAPIGRLVGRTLRWVQIVGGGLAARSCLVACICRLACGRLVGAPIVLLRKARLLLGHLMLSASNKTGEETVWACSFVFILLQKQQQPGRPRNSQGAPSSS